MKTYQTLLTELHNGGVFQITLNRPDRLNALNAELLTELHDCLHEAEKNSNVKALLITGAGDKAFCAGADINQLAECNAQTGVAFAENGQSVFRHFETLNKPSLAAINGYAFGGGCELAMSATLRIASHTAQFGQPEVKLGVIPGYGGTQRLARLVGKGRAMELCITGRTIKAEEAHAWGLVSETVEPANLMNRAHEILNNILSLAPLAVASVMKVIDVGYNLTLDDALHIEATHFGLLCATEDKSEGVNAFLQKRKAAFKGK